MDICNNEEDNFLIFIDKLILNRWDFGWGIDILYWIVGFVIVGLMVNILVLVIVINF